VEAADGVVPKKEQVGVVLVDIAQEQLQSEHIQYQPLFKLVLVETEVLISDQQHRHRPVSQAMEHHHISEPQ
tara:strand:+ start:672 stop:887 length:216 start_codon:yes stop_codon:yes gene_type:complete